MEISGVNGASDVVDAASTGFAGLTADHFLTLLITELQNQDPTEPMKNEDLLNQLSMMSSLQSNNELGEALKAIASSQQLSTAATFIGKSVTGTDVDRQTITGIVDRAFSRDGQVFVGIGDAEIPMNNVTSINLPEAA